MIAKRLTIWLVVALAIIGSAVAGVVAGYSQGFADNEQTRNVWDILRDARSSHTEEALAGSIPKAILAAGDNRPVLVWAVIASSSAKGSELKHAHEEAISAYCRSTTPLITVIFCTVVGIWGDGLPSDICDEPRIRTE